MRDLTDKQKRFCEEYLVDLNATQAAIRAGYSEKTAKAQANQLLDNTLLLDYLDKLRNKTSKKLQITRERQLKRYNKIFKKAEESEYYPAALKALERIDKLMGFEAPVKTENEHSIIWNETVINDPDEETE